MSSSSGSSRLPCAISYLIVQTGSSQSSAAAGRQKEEIHPAQTISTVVTFFILRISAGTGQDCRHPPGPVSIAPTASARYRAMTKGRRLATRDAFAKTKKALAGSCLGIIGAGRLGRALAAGLASAGFDASQLLICHRGSPETRSALVELGLSSRVVGIDELARRSRILFVALRPQERKALEACPVQNRSLVVSFMAGIPLSRLPTFGAGVERARIMPSAPDTIARRMGIAGVFPAASPVVAEICAALGLAAVPLSDEEDFHAFTALGPCLPIALALWRSLGRSVDEAALLRLAESHALGGYGRILAWALNLPMVADGPGSLEDLLLSAATKGGVTSAILEAIRAGRDLVDALEEGMRRSRALLDSME